MTSKCISRSVSLISALVAGCGSPQPAPPQPAPAPAPVASAPPPAAPVEPADVALLNGDVWTMDPNNPRVKAVAWRGDQIIAAGDDAAVRVYVGDKTRIVDLRGRAVTPGLVDAHCHLYGLGMDLEEVSLRDLPSEDAAVKAVAGSAADHPAPQWLRGRGWDQNKWPGQKFPTRATIDKAVSDRPVVMTRVDGHAIWVNSAALKLAGITKTTPDPAGGKIVRDRAGEATGVLIDNAEQLVFAKAPPAPPELREQRIVAAAKVAIAAGLTAVHDMGIDEDVAASYAKLAAAHQLPIRVHAYMSAPADIHRLDTPPTPAVGRFDMRGIKLYADGALGSRGARLYEPYSDDPGNRGLWRTEPAKLTAYTEAAVAHGWQVAVHAIGDAAVGAVLDAFLAAEKAHPGDHRLRVEHAQIIAPKDLPRMVAAHAIASMQPTHGTSDMGWAEARVGHERIQGAYAWRTVLSNHIPFAGGSDFPVERVPPLLGLYAAVTRQDAAGKPAGGWYPEQKMTLDEAVDAFTHGAAYAEGTEATRGMIAVGRKADFTIFSGTLAPDHGLLDLLIDDTVVEGEIVFQREPGKP